MNYYYVYKITNKINNKKYIGKTNNPKKRWRDHQKIAEYKRPNVYSYLHKAINKYGISKFTFKVLHKFNNEMFALTHEQKLIKKFKTKNCKFGYNLTDGGEGVSGYKYTDAQCKAISKRMKGKYVGKANPFYGKKHSLTTKKLIGKIRRSAKFKKQHRHKYIGSNHSQSKLTEKQVLKIRKLFSTTIPTCQRLAVMFGVCTETIRRIVNNEIWTHVKMYPKISLRKMTARFWNYKLGKIITKTLKCGFCKKSFKIKGRINSKFITKNKPKYCCNRCKCRANGSC